MKQLIGVAVATAVLLLFMVRNAFSEKLVQETVELRTKRPFKPFKLLFLADVHRRVIRTDLFDVPADIIVIGGDLAERGVPLDRIAKNIKNLTALAPVYFIWGNNDREVDESSLREIFTKYGVIVLDDQSVPLFGNDQLKLVGFDRFAYKTNGFENAFQEVRQHDTVIFVSHTPFDFWKVKPPYAADLLLAGHTHGGQIRIGPFGLFRKGSIKIKNDRVELVSNGFGTTGLHLRLGAQAEYHVLTILPKTGAAR